MFLPALAKDLYKAQKEVEQIEKKLAQKVAVVEQEKLKEELRQANAELSQLKKIMEGRKEQSRASLHKPKNRFGL
jgi:predicted transcriptional regulator